MCAGRHRGRGGFLGRPTESPTAPRNAPAVAQSTTNPCAPDANLFPASRLPMCKQSRSRLHGWQPCGGGPRTMLNGSRPEHPEARTLRGRTRTRPRMADNVAGGVSGIVEMDSERAQRRAEHARQGLRTEMHSMPPDAVKLQSRQPRMRPTFARLRRAQLRPRSGRRDVRTAIRSHADNARRAPNGAGLYPNATSRIANESALIPNRFSTFTRIRQWTLIRADVS